MLLINGNPIIEEPINILQRLKDDLSKMGISRFNQIKEGSTDIQFNCPIHSDGQEKRPSCGMTKVTKETMKGQIIEAGTVHCFACGYVNSLPGMISDLFGYDDNGKFGERWILRNFASISMDTRRDLNLDLTRDREKKVVEYISEDELNRYRYYHPYMYERGLTDEIIDNYDIGFDNNFNLNGQIIPTITFPVRDKRGKTLFIARRAIEYKFYHYPDNVEKPVYGIYELGDVEEIVVCEGILDALTVVKYGKPAVALLGLGTNNQYEELTKATARKLIIGFDNDKAGIKATKRLKDYISRYKLVTSYRLPDGKDLNDLTEKEFNNLTEIL